jgi:hypothetical protein
VPESFSRVIQVMLAKQPAVRYPSPIELLTDLEALEKGSAPTPRGSPKPVEAADVEAPPGFFDRQIGLIWLIAAVWLLVLSAGVNVVLFLR